MTEPAPYRVLARKYRPADFAALVGQEAMVRTLTNAFEGGRIAHAFILTGVRGIGKTTTARIIAKGLNCIGADGAGGPTVEPCGVCEPCRSITEDRNVDVIEMDAASRTGIGDIREIIDAVRYAPASARFKVYIIDEVHMLSNAAFNGLLKTLEEPPPHVKFIFATTEIRKVPVTVLSRCQRFDLRRLDTERMIAHLGDIAARESVAAEPEALALIARAAEGSVRDGLSLLDQAIAHGNGAVLAGSVRDMLGLADRAQVFDLFDVVMRGDAPGALTRLRGQYDIGADPEAIVRDLLELTHWLTRIRVVPAVAEDPAVSQTERDRGRELAKSLGMPVLQRTWSMLLKGLSEVRGAPSPIAAAEMVLLRLAHVSDLPTPGDLVAKLTQGGLAAAPARAPAAASPPPPAPPRAQAVGAPRQPMLAPGPQLVSQADPQAATMKQPGTLEEIVELAQARGAAILKSEIILFLRPIRIETGRIEFSIAPHAPADFSQRLARELRDWTGRPWGVIVSTQPGEPSLAERESASKAAVRAEAERHPLVQAVMEAFPGAVIQAITPPLVAPPAATEDDIPPPEPEDDP